MSLEKLKARSKTYRRLLEADVLGSFDFFTCIVCLDSVNTLKFEQFKKALASKDYFVLSKIVPLAVHEFTHFIDSTATLWGMNHLQKMDDAYCSNNIRGGSESDFFKAKYFLEHTRSLRLPSYYTLIDSSKMPTRPWQSKITMGKQFGLDGRLSEKPVLFSQFSNAHGELLARSPISTVSILEASAMSNEMVTRLALINDLGVDERLVENCIYQNESLDYIYNQNITEYSVCVHVLANQIQCKDLFVAFQAVSIITRLVLNFPKSLIDTLIESNAIHTILQPSKDYEFENRMKSGLKHHDLGVLYYLICSALPMSTSDSREKMISGIETALSKFNLSIEQVYKGANKEIEEICAELKGSKLKVIQSLSKAGKDNFDKIPGSSANLDMSNLSLPAVYLGDGKEVVFFRNGQSLLANISLEEIFEELYEGQKWVERFSEACTA